MRVARAHRRERLACLLEIGRRDHDADVVRRLRPRHARRLRVAANRDPHVVIEQEVTDHRGTDRIVEAADLDPVVLLGVVAHALTLHLGLALGLALAFGFAHREKCSLPGADVYSAV